MDVQQQELGDGEFGMLQRGSGDAGWDTASRSVVLRIERYSAVRVERVKSRSCVCKSNRQPPNISLRKPTAYPTEGRYVYFFLEVVFEEGIRMIRYRHLPLHDKICYNELDPESCVIYRSRWPRNVSTFHFASSQVIR